MSGTDYLGILEVVAFISIAWLAGRLFGLFKISPLLGEIITGVVMGPHVLDVIPYTGGHGTDEDHDAPNIWVMMGTVSRLCTVRPLTVQ